MERTGQGRATPTPSEVQFRLLTKLENRTLVHVKNLGWRVIGDRKNEIFTTATIKACIRKGWIRKPLQGRRRFYFLSEVGQEFLDSPAVIV